MTNTNHNTEYVTQGEVLKSPVPASYAPNIINSFKGQPGLYLHVPFCEYICPFCPYNKVLYDEKLVASYFNALNQEINHYLKYTSTPFSSLYIGGGTPTLCLEQLGDIIERIPVAGERAIEVLPGHATRENIGRLRELGINYLSLGVQSFDESVLNYLKRPNTVAQNHAALNAAIGEFDCVDVDLIFDVAFEDRSIFLHDLETCFKANVEQVSTYPLMRFGYTPFGKSGHQSKKEHEILKKAEELAQQYNYERRSVWTFNRRDASNYTSITREFYLGCGAGAGSYTGSLFFLNHFSIPDYIQKVMAGNLPIARAHQLSQRKAAAYYLFWQAYTGKVNLAHFDKLFPKQGMLKNLLYALIKFGIFKSQGEELLLTQQGYDHYHDLERWVTYHFIEPLWADMMHEHTHLQDYLLPLSGTQRFWLRLAGMNKTQTRKL